MWRARRDGERQDAGAIGRRHRRDFTIDLMGRGEHITRAFSYAIAATIVAKQKIYKHMHAYATSEQESTEDTRSPRTQRK